MARASRGCITAISRNSLLTGNLFLAYNNCEIMFGQGIPLPELVFNRAFIRTVEFESTVLFVNKKNQKNFRECWRILNLPDPYFGVTDGV